MYEWYSNASECIIYMKDVYLDEEHRAIQQFQSSTWFRRGWTLQEMLAPTVLIFCKAQWKVIGHQLRHNSDGSMSPNALISKRYGPSLQSQLSRITAIHEDFLSGVSNLREASIAHRMGWASRRATTRVEDEAYCLLGIFDINMPLIYGEGRKAFIRLQEEIIRRSTDQSILAWNTSSSFPPTVPILATTPKDFPIVTHQQEKVNLDMGTFTITNRGLEMRGDIMEVRLGVTDALAEYRSGDLIDQTLGYCYLVLNYEIQGKRLRILLKGMRANLYHRVNRGKKDEDEYSDREVGEVMKEKLIYLGIGNEIVLSKTK